MGIDKEKYKEAQSKIAEQDFKYNTCQEIQNLKFAIDEINDELTKLTADSSSNEKENEIQIDKVMQTCVTSLKEFRSTFDGLERKVSDCASWSKTLNNSIEDCPTRQEFEKKLSNLLELLRLSKLEKESMYKDFKSLIERMQADFEARLKATKEEIFNLPSELPEFKKLVNQKIEFVDLNGQNAVLRSSNNERQIQLVERKIEHIYQLIKKNDLTRQESL